MYIFFRGSVFCLPDDVFVFFVLAFTLLESSVHHAGVHIGRAAKGQHEVKYDPNSISIEHQITARLPIIIMSRHQ